MSISSRITSIEEHIGDTYDVLELGGFNPYLLPKEYTQLEYIESSKTQYIDTGITPDTTLEFDTTFNTSDSLSSNGYGCIFGSRVGSGNKDVQLTTYSEFGYSGTIRWGNTYGGNAYLSNNTKINVKLKDNKYYVDNEEKQSITINASNDYNICIFGLNAGGVISQQGSLKLYTFKLWKNGSLVRDYIPCKNASDEVGLYDLVSKTFFANAGTGTFTAGAENRQKVVNKNIENIAPSIKQKYLDYMNNGTREIWNNWEKVPTGTGENVTLNNTVQAPMDLGVEGNTSQVQLTGRQLLNPQKVIEDSNKTSIYIVDNEYIRFMTGAQKCIIKPNTIEESTAYTFKLILKSNVSETNTIAFRAYYTDETNVQLSKTTRTNTNEFEVIFSTDSSKTLEYISTENYSNKEVYIKINGSMIVKGTYTSSNIPAYEPYVGGTASPNPSYPQAITNVTGDVEVLVQNKNLAWNGWAEDFVERVNNNAQAKIETYNNRNCVYYTANVSYNAYDTRYIFKPKGGFKENTQYTFSFDILKTSSTNRTFAILYTDGTTTANNILSSVNTWEHQTVTSVANKTILSVISYLTSGETYIDLDTFMVEENTTASTYTPHQEQTLPLTLGDIELCKIGTAQDYFYKENNKWYLYKAIGKTIFDGSSDENWSYYSNTGVTNRRFIIAISDMKQGTNNQYPVLCNRFKQGAQSTDDNFIFVTASNKIVWFGSTDLQSLDTTGFKTWLSSNNVIVYYLLETPTITEITDTTMISQLEAISNSISYNEQTNISGSSDELNPIFTVVALKNI